MNINIVNYKLIRGRTFSNITPYKIRDYKYNNYRELSRNR